MSVLEVKQAVTSKFFSEWTETVIHWHGLEFDNSSIDEWIRVEYIPNETYNSSIDSRMDSNSGWIAIDVFARKENRTYELYDMIVQMLSLERIGGNSVKTIDIQGKDTISTDNGDYKILIASVYLKSF